MANAINTNESKTMSNELKQHVIDSLRVLRDAGYEIPTGEDFKPWLEAQIRERKPIICGILRDAIRNGIA